MRGYQFSLRTLALAASFLAGAAHAATADERRDMAGAPAQAAKPVKDDNEIIVTTTAQKRFENIQNVPLAVQVVTPAQLEAQGVRHFQDLGKVAPSLVVRTAENPVNSNVSLRGVGTFAFGIGVESSVAVTVDGVPLAFQARAFTDLPDVAMIEVLRGPQSTLYG
ncbi:TonB-dependent receptor plug domain-containing protein, partial [Sphingomonas elodea]|uniref:TonB-dependent receptor plug domain-containing protein n=1 Tax=Sphingomonas elodea TaxID=179878 RepID=UPI0002630B42